MPSIEREIAAKFEEIADIGWFPENIPADSAPFTVVRSVLEPLAGKRILDAGCARGRFAKRLAPLGADMRGLDLTETFLQSARMNVPEAAFTRGSISAVPFVQARSMRFIAWKRWSMCRIPMARYVR
jgi:2-polyprenyl-3-methyl-5-hydroxy-6-metoxy-1,4-benzoquinol methylase